jgi:hypothetical protein
MLVVLPCNCKCAPSVDPCNCAGSCSVECSTISGTYTLCGWSEFTSPSTPPKKYLNRTISGSISTNSYNPNNSCSANFDGVVTYTFGGFQNYSATDCSITTGGSTTCSPADGHNCPHAPICPRCDSTPVPGIDGLGCLCANLLPDTYTPTVHIISADGICHPTGPASSNRSSGSAVDTLSNEDTEENAIARMPPPKWSDWSSAALCCASMPPRTAFSGAVNRAKIRVKGKGTPGTLATASVKINRRVYGTGVFALFMTVPLQLNFDSSGNATSNEFEIPNQYGYETCYGSCSVKAN